MQRATVAAVSPLKHYRAARRYSDWGTLRYSRGTPWYQCDRVIGEATPYLESARAVGTYSGVLMGYSAVLAGSATARVLGEELVGDVERDLRHDDLARVVVGHEQLRAGTQGGYSGHRVLTGYSRGTREVLRGYS